MRAIASERLGSCLYRVVLADGHGVIFVVLGYSRLLVVLACHDSSAQVFLEGAQMLPPHYFTVCMYVYIMYALC